ncbi:MAG: DUF1638 domain-containing protein [Planctomycetes bacterium]|nr:DUF1638 domain-containing protein [Planctomycetota bacterium]
MAYYKMICCEVLFREVCLECAHSPHQIDLSFNRFGLHGVSQQQMQTELQALVDGGQKRDYDAVLMGYGLCNNGLLGLTAREIPVVVPRAHDCISLLLGSKERYREEFDQEPGTYYDSPGWIEHHHPGDEDYLYGKLGMTMSRAEMVERYGEENADYLMETMGGMGGHNQSDKRRAYIDTGVGPTEQLEKHSRQVAQDKGWNFERMKGDRRLIRMLVNGQWPGEEFLVIAPGQKLKATHDERVIGT